MGAENTPSQDAASVMATKTVEQLKVACEEGSQAACAELDRRGVEPETLEPVPPIESLDIAREERPNANFLRQLASTLKLEAALLDGYADKYAEHFAMAPLGSEGEARALKLALAATKAASAMQFASENMLMLAGLVARDVPGVQTP